MSSLRQPMDAHSRRIHRASKNDPISSQLSTGDHISYAVSHLRNIVHICHLLRICQQVESFHGWAVSHSNSLGEKEFHEIPLAYLSGPSFASEMVAGHPMSVVVASLDLAVATHVQSALSSKSFRIYVTDDVVGVEVGGALKNPLAIGAGMAAGLGFGQSTIAGLVTRGCREMSTLSVALGGRGGVPFFFLCCIKIIPFFINDKNILINIK